MMWTAFAGLVKRRKQRMWISVLTVTIVVVERAMVEIHLVIAVRLKNTRMILPTGILVPQQLLAYWNIASRQMILQFQLLLLSAIIVLIKPEDNEDIRSSSPESAGTCTPATASPFQEQLQIENPPSSPESSYTVTEGNRTKASEWLLQTHPVNSDEVERCIDKTPRTPRGIDSAKKSRCNKFVPLGLAQRLSTMVKRERAEVAFFEHQTKMLQRDETLRSRQLLSIKIHNLVNAYSLFIGTGKVLASPASILGFRDQASSMAHKMMGNGGSRIGPGGDQPEVIVVFSSQIAGHLNLRVGSHVNIYSPWQCITLSQLDKQVILCPHFCEAVGCSPVRDEVASPVICHQRGVDGMSPLSHSAKAVSPLGSILHTVPSDNVTPSKQSVEPHVHLAVSVQSPACTDASSSLSKKSNQSLLPTRLLAKLEREATSVLSVVDANGTKPALSTMSQENSSVQKCPGLLEAIESGFGGIISFTAFVLRIYRRKISVEDQQNSPFLLSKSLLHRAKHRIAYGGDRWCWVLLLCDFHGVYAELQLSDDSIGQWEDVIKTGEGRLYQFMNVQVHHRVTLSRAPDVFNLISCLQFHRVIAQTLTAQEEVASPQGGVPPLYVLIVQQSSGPVPDARHTLPITCLRPPLRPSPSLPVTYADLLAKVVYTHHKESDGSCLQPDCYMFVALADSDVQSTLVTVYLRPSYCLEGLLKVLKTTGAGVLLRDVETCSSDSEGVCYSMNACSLLLPVDAQLLDPSVKMKIYPQKSFDALELQLVASIRPPVLHPLTPLTAVVGSLISISGSITGIDEENAYSWMACNSCGCTSLISKLEVGGSPCSQQRSYLHCSECEKLVSSPAIHLQLAIFLSHPEFKEWKIHVKLLQTTIQQLLPITASNLDEGFDVHLILNKNIMLRSCYVTDIAGGDTLKLDEVDAFANLQI
eukprot:Em0018g537a